MEATRSVARPSGDAAVEGAAVAGVAEAAGRTFMPAALADQYSHIIDHDVKVGCRVSGAPWPLAISVLLSCSHRANTGTAPPAVAGRCSSAV